MQELLLMCATAFCGCFAMVFGALAGGFCVMGLHNLWEKWRERRDND